MICCLLVCLIDIEDFLLFLSLEEHEVFINEGYPREEICEEDHNDFERVLRINELTSTLV